MPDSTPCSSKGELHTIFRLSCHVFQQSGVPALRDQQKIYGALAFLQQLVRCYEKKQTNGSTMRTSQCPEKAQSCSWSHSRSYPSFSQISIAFIECEIIPEGKLDCLDGVSFSEDVRISFSSKHTVKPTMSAKDVGDGLQ